jgi:hypothetical protein
MKLLIGASYLGWRKLALTPALSPRRGGIVARPYGMATTISVYGFNPRTGPEAYSLTPNFSWVCEGLETHKPFQRLPNTQKTFETVFNSFPSGSTRLKPGVNDKII